MSALHRIGIFLLLAMLVMTLVHVAFHPVRRDRIKPISTGYRINVNIADVPTLSLLSGISTKIGEYLIAEREQHGPFKNPADLDRVNRIGPVTIQKIEPYVTFDLPLSSQ